MVFRCGLYETVYGQSDITWYVFFIWKHMTLLCYLSSITSWGWTYMICSAHTVAPFQGHLSLSQYRGSRAPNNNSFLWIIPRHAPKCGGDGCLIYLPCTEKIKAPNPIYRKETGKRKGIDWKYIPKHLLSPLQVSILVGHIGDQWDDPIRTCSRQTDHLNLLSFGKHQLLFSDPWWQRFHGEEEMEACEPCTAVPPSALLPVPQ